MNICVICKKEFPPERGCGWHNCYCSVECENSCRCVICERIYPRGKDAVTQFCSPACVRVNKRKLREQRREWLATGKVGHYDPKSIFERDAYVCYLCGALTNRDAKVPDPSTPTIDHVVPLCREGRDNADNVRCCCYRCNCKKGTDTLEEYRAYAKAFGIVVAEHWKPTNRPQTAPELSNDPDAADVK